MRHAVEKCREAGNTQVFLTERGSSFGYNNLVVDMRSLAIMRKFAPVVFDATHSVQLPSAQADDERSRGERRTAGIHSGAGACGGCGRSGWSFSGSSRQSEDAKSDGANALESTKLREVLKELLAVRKALDAARSTP